MTSTPSALNRSTAELSPTTVNLPGTVPTTQAPAGRRISFVAWGAAGIVSLALYALIFKVVG